MVLIHVQMIMKQNIESLCSFLAAFSDCDCHSPVSETSRRQNHERSQDWDQRSGASLQQMTWLPVEEQCVQTS